MRASIDLFLNFATYDISEGLHSVELGGHIAFNQWTIRPGLQLDLVVHDNGDILMVRTHLSVIRYVCFAILVKIFPHQRRNFFGLD